MDVPISVIIPCYCCQKTIKRTLQSVLNQTYRPSEILVIEDGSPDHTLTYLKNLENQYVHNGLKVIPLTENRGVSIARNTGWEKASQPYLAFLDADDIWHPQKIELQYQWLIQHPHFAGCGHNYKILNQEHPENLEFYSLKPHFCDHQISSQEILLTNPLPTSSLLIKKDIPYRFDASRNYCEDYQLLMDLILDNYSLAYLDIPAVIYDNATLGLSANRWRMRQAQISLYYQLWQTQKITFSMYLFYSGYSILKFILYISSPKLHFWLKKLIARPKINTS